MEKRPPQLLTPFDMMVTSPQLQTMKLLLPYLPSVYQRMLAFYIKFTELQNTLSHFSSMHTSPKKSNTTPFDMLEEIRPYMDPKDFESIDSLLSMLNMMEMMQAMNGNDMPDFSNMGDMSGMADIMNMMNMFHSESPDSQTEQKGNENNDRK